MKKILTFIIILVLALSICACGGNGNEEKTVSNDNKGSRENPYQVGETIKIENAYIPDYYIEDTANIPFTIDLVFTELIDKEQGVSMMESKYGLFTFIPAAKLSFSVEGDYSDAIDFISFLDIRSVTDEMEITSAWFNDEKDDSLNQFYTGTTYERYLAVPHDSKSNEDVDYKYFTMEYYTDAKGENRETIYVSLENTPMAEDSENVNAQDNSGESAEEMKYKSALSAEKNLQYTYAKRLYAELKGYKDSQDRMENMISILSKYNGTYYGKSLKFENVNVYMYVQDGTVRFKYDSEGEELSPSVYEIYGAELDEGLHEDTVIVGSERMSDSYSPTTNYIWAPQEDGTVSFVAWTGNSTSNTWNGEYEKISDSVDVSME